jgi:HD-GYP domain-containing protein (c-di-GMP phosphodiesterase class II)
MIVRSVGERWDGSGGPDGLAEDRIALASRVVAVCSAYESLTSERPCRAALSHGAAVAELQQSAGTQLDPAIVEVLAAGAERSPAPVRVA